MLARIGRVSSVALVARAARTTVTRPVHLKTSRASTPLFAKLSQVRFHSSGGESFEELSKKIETKLRSGLKDIKHLSIQDARGDGSFLHIWVVSADFDGKLPLKQHQLVNSLLKEEIPQVHGVSLKTQTPSAYERTK